MIEGLMRWYIDRCDGEWEHKNGFTIESTDNPGVIIRLDLTERDPLPGQPDRVIRSEGEGTSEWLDLRVRGGQLVGFASPILLPQLMTEIDCLLSGAHSQSDLPS